MSRSTRLAAFPLRFLVALAMVGALLPLAASQPAAVVGADFSGSAGRLVVLWRTDAAPTLGLAGVTKTMRSANSRRSIVVAAAGQIDAVIAQLRQDPRVAAIVPDARVSVDTWPVSAPDDTYYAGFQPDLPLIGVPTVWQMTTGSPSVVVAVLDTGMTTTVEDLDGVSIVSPRNEIGNTTNVTDGHGHGTHVIGTIAAETNNGVGVAGIAPGVSIMPVKVLDDTGSGWFSDILDGIDWARTHGASVISMSLGGSLDPASAAFYQRTFDAAYAAGITILAAAGNSGTSDVSYPGGFTHVLGIGATDNRDAIASFSQHNATVDLSAPGVNTFSVGRTGNYVSMSGTSMATPHVAGIVGLLRSAHPTWTPDQIETALRSTALDLGAAGRDDYFGSGRINAAGAVAYTFAPAPTPSPSPIPVPPDTTRPTVTGRTPASRKTGVDRDTSIAVRFSEPVRGMSKTTVRLVRVSNGTVVSATVSYNSTTRTTTINPTHRLSSWATYRVEVRSGVKDLVANPVVTTSWRFKTGSR